MPPTEETLSAYTARYASPEIFYTIETLKVGPPGSETTLPVAELVRRGAELAGFPDYSQQKKRGFLRSPIAAGENVIYTPETFSLNAACTGYPKQRSIPQEEGPDILEISIVPAVKITLDRMKASIVIHPPIQNAAALTPDIYNELLEEAGVVYGVMAEALEKVTRCLVSDYADFEEIIVAKGSLPGEGKDACLRFAINTGTAAGTRLNTGAIDFSERKLMIPVRKGQLLATKVRAVPGKPGYNVLGEEIPPKTGKDILVVIRGRAVFNPADNSIVATEDGALSLVNNTIIHVTTTETVPGDVDASTGNIETPCNIRIRGTVQAESRVNAGGDLLLGGGILSASVKLGGNAIVRSGITGQNSIIQASGDVDIAFVERSTVHAGGTAIIRKQTYYSTVESARNICCPEESAVVGSTLMAGQDICVCNVGTPTSEPAFLAAGIDPERYRLFLKLQQEYNEIEESLINALQSTSLPPGSKKIRKMEAEAEETRDKLQRLNLIPGTELYSRIGTGKSRDELDEEAPLYNTGVNIENVRIEITGKVCGGTRLMIGNRMATISEDSEKKRYRLSKNLRHIMATPLREERCRA